MDQLERLVAVQDISDLVGRYEDQLVVEGGSWKFRRRVERPVQFVPGPPPMSDAANGVSGATISRDGAIRAAGPHAAALATDAVALLDRWTVQGAPALPRWRATMALAGDPAQPILVPRTWELEPALQP